MLSLVNFTTAVRIKKTLCPLMLGGRTLALGSCFAERIGEKLQRALSPTSINPKGIRYNPASLALDLECSQESTQLFLHENLWRSFLHHSSLAGRTVGESRELLRQAEARRSQALDEATLLLVTLGTAQVFQLFSSGTIVSNCHRLPQALFRRRNLTVEESVAALAPNLCSWLDESCERRVILTVSPIRHLRGGLIANSRSKAVLLLACAELEKLHSRLEYFPAYEIVMDELRGYRFFEEDMIRPNPQAVQHIWELFCSTYFREKERKALDKIEKVQKLAEHRLSPNSKLEDISQKALGWLGELDTDYPQLQTKELGKFFQSLEKKSCRER